MSRIRTVFLGTPQIARHCLEGLIRDEHFEVVGVVTQPDRPAGRSMKLLPSPVKELVAPLGIPLFTPESVNAPEVLASLSKLSAEVAIVVAYGQIVSDAFLQLFPQKVVNVHASLLPRWRGAAPIQRALMAGDKETGVSLQVMVKKLDAGDVIGWRKFIIAPEDGAGDLMEKMKALASELLRVDLMDYLRGNLTPMPQDEAQMTLAPKIQKSEAVIDWQESATEIHNLVRALALGPFATTTRGERSLKIHKSKVSEEKLSLNFKPGQLISSQASKAVVVCGEKALELLVVQPESRSRMTIAEYLKGYPVGAEDFLGKGS